MLIPETMTLYFLAGVVFGAVAALFIRFLIGLLRKLDEADTEHAKRRDRV